MEIPDQRPPKPEDRSRVEEVDALFALELGDGTRLVPRQRWTYRDEWVWIGCWANFGEVIYHDLPPRIEGTPRPPKRSWLRRLFGR